MDITTAYKIFMDYIKDLDNKTQKVYGRNIDSFIQYIDKDDVVAITIEDVYGFRDQLKEQGSRPATVYNYLISIRLFLKYLKDLNVAQFPVDLIKIPRVGETLKDHVTKEDFECIDQYLDHHSYRMIQQRLMNRLMWSTGARINEILSLNLTDIDPQKPYVTIKRRGKSLRPDIISWSEEDHEILLLYLGMRMQVSDHEALFVPLKRTQSRMTARSVQRWVKQWCEATGIKKKLTPHSYRHGAGHRYIMNGATNLQTALMLGHKGTQSVMSYSRLNEQEQFKLQNQFRDLSDQLQETDKIDELKEVLEKLVRLNSGALFGSQKSFTMVRKDI